MFLKSFFFCSLHEIDPWSHKVIVVVVVVSFKVAKGYIYMFHTKV